MKRTISLTLAIIMLLSFCLTSCSSKTESETSVDAEDAFLDKYNHTECSDGASHDYTSTTQKATCTERGYVTNTCSKCGYTYLSETENALGHNWGEPTITKKLTCTEDGLQTVKCTVCGETKEETLPHVGHNYVPVEEEESFDFEISDPDEDISFAEDDGVTTYVCSVCNDSITIGDEEELPEPVEDVKMLMGRDTTFSFLVACDNGKEYINSNLTIVNTFTDKKVAFEVEKENDVYRITPKTPYEEYGVYTATPNENISFVDYNAKALEFEVKGPDKTNVTYNDDNLVFLKALEQNSPGYYPYEIEEDEAAGKQYLTLSKTGAIDSSYIGKVICVGDYLNSEELLADITKEVYLGKIERIYRNADGKTELELSAPDISDVFDELDVYSNGGFGSATAVLNENFEDEFKASVIKSDSFINYTAAMTLAAKDYADDMNVVAIGLWDDVFKDNVDFKFTKKGIKDIGDGKIKIDIEGTLTYTIPLKTKGGKSVGDITMVCTAGADSELHFSGYFYKDLSAHLGVYANSDARLSFELKFNLKQSLSNETRYYVNNKTDTIHTGTCRMVTKVTDVSNLSIYTASELLHQYNGDRELMKTHECGICKAVTGLDGSAYILNNNTKTLHCLNCVHVNSIDQCNVYEIYPKDVSGFKTCDSCRPQDRQGKDFEKRMQNAMAGSDWGEQINALKESLEQSKDEDKSESRGNVIGYVPFSFMGVFNVNFAAALVFDFDLEATVKASYTTGSEVWFGVHIKPGEYRPYYEERKKTPTHTLDVTGKIGAELGFRFTAEANVITKKLACIKLFAEVGVYCDASGILHSESTADGRSNSYFAAHLEIGLYYEVDGYWKILGWDGNFSLVSKNKIPYLERGYSRAYYAFESYDRTLTIDKKAFPYKSLINADCMEVMYLDLRTLKTKTGHLTPWGNDDYSIKYSFTNEDGSKNENFAISKAGFLMLKEDAPKEFTAYMHITVVPKKAPISSIKEFFASEYSRTSYGYFLDTNTVKIVVDLEDNADEEVIAKSNALLEAGKLKEAIMTLYNCGSDSDAINEAIDKFYERVSFDIVPTTTLCEDGYNFVDERIYEDYYSDEGTALFGIQLVDNKTKKRETVATITTPNPYYSPADARIECQNSSKAILIINYDLAWNVSFLYDIQTNNFKYLDGFVNVNYSSQELFILEEGALVRPDTCKFSVYDWNGQLIFEDSTIDCISCDGEWLYYVDIAKSHFTDNGYSETLYVINKAKANGSNKQELCSISSPDSFIIFTLESHYLYYYPYGTDGVKQSIDLRNPHDVTISQAKKHSLEMEFTEENIRDFVDGIIEYAEGADILLEEIDIHSSKSASVQMYVVPPGEVWGVGIILHFEYSREGWNEYGYLLDIRDYDGNMIKLTDEAVVVVAQAVEKMLTGRSRVKENFDQCYDNKNAETSYRYKVGSYYTLLLYYGTASFIYMIHTHPTYTNY